MKVITQLILCMSIILFAGCDKNPTEPDIQGAAKEIDETGGTITLGDVTVEIPANVLSGEATFTLQTLDYNPADSLDVEAELISQAVSLTIGTADITDTVFVIIPAIDTSDIWNVVGFQAGGIWYPLNIVEQDNAKTRAAILPHLFGQDQGKSRRVEGGCTSSSYTIAAMNLDVPDPDGISLIAMGHLNIYDQKLMKRSSEQSESPMIILIHGILADGSTWKNEFTEPLISIGADVASLNYPWRRHFMDVAGEVIALLKQQVGNRDIYLVCHSKGGLLGRAIIRRNETEGAGLSIRKAIYIATPHYGVNLELIEEFVDKLAPKTSLFILKRNNFWELDGIEELAIGSNELSEIAQPLSFLFPPLYKCIIGNYLWGNTDMVVSLSSADLALQDHYGERENAVYYSTLTTTHSHLDITDYHDDTWPVIEEFLRVDPGPQGEFVLIPTGTFMMGSPADELLRDSDETLHSVTLAKSYYMFATEVTNQQYADMAQWAYNNGYCSATSTSLRDNLDGSSQELLDLDDNRCAISFSGSTFIVDNGKENHPVQEVTWYGAVAYCDWLSINGSFSRAYNHSTWECNNQDPYNAQGYRLPTEAEWEYACRAGTHTPFNTGICLDAGTEANYNGNHPYTGCPYGSNLNGTVMVKSYPANAFGIYDMHGNLWEWCNDWYGEYSGNVTDPDGPNTGSIRVTRGGNWGYNAERCRSADRYYSIPDGSTNDGFRPVRSAF